MIRNIFLACVYFLVASPSFAQQLTKVNPIIDTTFDDVSKGKLQEAVKMLTEVFNSEEFKKQVRSENFNFFNEGFSSDEILEIILSGRNDINSDNKDYSIDLHLSLYDKYRGNLSFGATGMEYIPRVTTTHRCYVLNNNAKCYASHLAHEYMHQIGFWDYKKRFTSGKKTQSVPYRIGNIVDRLLGNTQHCEAQDSNCTKE